MLIDWFTVAAQALNFFILVWLLKRYLYKPILDAIAARETLIAKELSSATAKQAEAQKDRDDFQHKNEDFDKQRAALMAKATDDAKAERERLLDDARKAADSLSAKRRASLENDIAGLNQSIGTRTRDEVFSITRKTLTDLANTSLEERIAEVFTHRLRNLDSAARQKLGDALKSAAGPALIRSTFDLGAGQQAAIQNALNETFSADLHLQFATTPDLISGIELTSNGQKLAWNIQDYLGSLQKDLSELVQQQSKPPEKATAQASG